MNFSDDFINKCRNAFVQELEAKDLSWRVCRQNTFLDLIFINLSKCRLDPSEENFLNVFNLCFKSIIVNRMGEVDLNNDPTQILDNLGSDNDKLLLEYDQIIVDVNGIPNPNSTLYNDELYFKTLLSLNIGYSENMALDLVSAIIQSIKM